MSTTGQIFLGVLVLIISSGCILVIRRTILEQRRMYKRILSDIKESKTLNEAMKAGDGIQRYAEQYNYPDLELSNLKKALVEKIKEITK